MATPDQIPSDLTLEVGDGAHPDQFMTAVRAFFGYVEEVARMVSADLEPMRWTVKVREGSSLLAIEPPPSEPRELVQFVYARVERGAEAVARGDLDDADLSEAALRNLRTLSELTEGPRSAIPIKLWVRKRPVTVVPDIARTIRDDWREDYRDYGTVEGRLRAIEDRAGGLRLQIRDAMLGQTIQVTFPETLLDDAFAAFRHRVEVTGLIHYRHNGVPISIQASHITTLPDDDELPDADEVRGILRVG